MCFAGVSSVSLDISVFPLIRNIMLRSMSLSLSCTCRLVAGAAQSWPKPPYPPTTSQSIDTAIRHTDRHIDRQDYISLPYISTINTYMRSILLMPHRVCVDDKDDGITPPCIPPPLPPVLLLPAHVPTLHRHARTTHHLRTQAARETTCVLRAEPF